MENFNVYDMKVGDSFEWKSFAGIKYTTTKVSDKYYETSWEDKCLQETYGAILNYTKLEHFKLLKVNFKNTFTKSDLISGEHIVETNCGKRYVVMGEYCIGEKGYHWLEGFKEDLTHKRISSAHIIKVFSGKSDMGICAYTGFEEYLYSEDLKLIYDRQENEHRLAKQAHLRSLEESIAEQEKEAEKLREELGL